MRILYLDLDTLRPDHLGCYGYHRNTSPSIDAVAGEGTRFNGCHCSDAPCLPARTAIMSGRFGIHTGVVGHGGHGADMRPEGPLRDFRGRLGSESLPAFLRQNGFKTASINPFAERHTAWWYYAGFDEIHNTGKYGGEIADDVSPVVMKWLNENADKDNWFLHVNFWDAHTPYRTPASFGDPFKDDPLPDWLTPEVFEGHRRYGGPHGAMEINMFDDTAYPQFPRHPGKLETFADVRRMIDGYDTGIRYMDSHIGRLLDYLREAGVYDDTAIIITADHGENLGELGIYGEHATADYPCTRVPMIVKWPGGAKNTVSDGLIHTLDLAPTLAELLGKPSKASWDGIGFAAPILGKPFSGRDYLVVGQCAHVCQRGVRFGDWMYVRTYHDGYHPFPKEMLFNIVNDPNQQVNLAAERPDLCRQAVHHMADWHDAMMLSSDSDVDPLWTVMRENGPYHTWNALPGFIQRLEASGRGEWAAELRKRL